MRRNLAVFAFAVALFWISVNFVFVQAGEKGFTGSELSATLNLIPGIVLIMAFIAAYRKLARTLIGIASMILLVASYLIFDSNWIGNAAVIAELERLTGILGGDHTQLGITITQTIWPTVSAVLGIIAALIGGYVVFSGRKVSPQKDSAIEAVEALDNRALWDQTEN
jgi:hypothetical protein